MLDIICLVKTKLDQFDTLHVNSFEYITSNRNIKKGVRHGDIAILMVTNKTWVV